MGYLIRITLLLQREDLMAVVQGTREIACEGYEHCCQIGFRDESIFLLGRG